MAVSLELWDQFLEVFSLLTLWGKDTKDKVLKWPKKAKKAIDGPPKANLYVIVPSELWDQFLEVMSSLTLWGKDTKDKVLKKAKKANKGPSKANFKCPRISGINS